MALSHELISQFAKLVVNKDAKQTETTVYGTVTTKDDVKYVTLDGSTVSIPIGDGDTTVEAKDGERVTVTIANHKAVVTGNVSSPAARSADLTATTEYFTKILADEVTLGKLTAAEANIVSLIAKEAEIEDLIAGKITVTDLLATKIDANVVIADKAIIDKLKVDNVDVLSLMADKAEIEKLIANNANLNSLEAKNAYLKFANVDFSNIGEATISKLFTDYGIIKELVIEEGTVVKELVGVTIKGDLVEAGTLKADRLVVLGSDGNYYTLNTNFEAMPGVDPVEEDAIHGSVLIKKSIVAEKIAVDDLVAFGATIGGFKITSDAIHSPAKTSADSSVEGIYMGSDGQFNVGNGSTYLKFFKDPDDNNKWKLEIRLSSGKTVEDAIDDIQIGGRNLLLNSAFKSGIDEWETEGEILNAEDVASGHQYVRVNNVLPQPHTATVRVYGKETGLVGSTITVSGKNLLPYPYLGTTAHVAGIDYTDNGDGTITASGTPESVYRTSFMLTKTCPFKNGVTYTFSEASLREQGFRFSLCYIDKETNTEKYPDKLYSITWDDSKYQFKHLAIDNGPSLKTVENVVLRPQIEIGMVETEYEPYKEPTVYTIDETSTVSAEAYAPSMCVISDVDGVNLDLTYLTPSGPVTKDDKTCLDIKHLSFGETKTVYQNVSTRVQPDTEYTLSGWVLTENVVKGTTNSRLVFCTDTQEIDMPITGGSWSYISWVFTTPKDMTELLVYAYTRDMTGDVYIRDLKLEKGNRATDWTPAPEDTENDIADTKNEILSETRASLEVSENSILSKVEGTYVTAGSFDSYKNDVSSYVDQKADELNIGFTRTTNSLEDRLDEEIDTREKHFKLSEDGLIISAGENSVRVVIDNDLICFTQSSGNTTELLTAGVEVLDDSKFKKGSGVYVVSDSYSPGYGYFAIFFDDGSTAALFYDDQSAIPTIKVGTRCMYNEAGPSLALIEERMLGYWDGDNFYAGNLVIRVDERAQFGNFAAIPRSNGNLSWLKVK